MASRTRSTAQDVARAKLSIGELSAATGLGIETLRAWERRYGRPRPERLPSGHRRYASADVPGLRLAAEAVASGRRPSEVLGLPTDALEAMLSSMRRPSAARSREDLEGLVALVRGFRGRELRDRLRRRARALGSRPFVESVVEPFGVLLGRGWAQGTLSIRHEHFATEALIGVLAGLPERRRPRAQAPLLLFTTLPGERHGVGCVVAAWVARDRGARADVLGPDTPIEEIASAAVEAGAVGVGISISLATGGVSSDRGLKALRRLLPPATALVVGGRGARGPRRGLTGVTFAPDLACFEAWVDERTAPHPRA